MASYRALIVDDEPLAREGIRDLLADGLIEECAGPPGADPRRTYVRLTSAGKRVAG